MADFDYGYDRRARHVVPFACALMVTNAALGQTASPTRVAAAETTGLEEIVVTAQKREQNLQAVPISITAITQESLVANRVADVRDLSAIAPNLTVRTGPGGANLPSYSLRGVVARAAGPGLDQGVSLYLDGVYLQNSLGAIFDLADIERIEVLKGPQGTLFGRNATGGAISIITRDPPGKFGVRQEFTGGNFDQFRSKTRVDLPTWGPLSATLTYVHSERRGDTLNLGAGTRWDYSAIPNALSGIRTSPKYLGDENIDAVSAAIKLQANDDLVVTYKLDYEQNHYTPEAQGLAGLNTAKLGALGPLLSAQLRLQPNPSQLTPQSTQRPNAVNNWFTTENFARNMGHNITASYAITQRISIRNIVSYRENSGNSTYQLDSLGGLVNVLPVFGPLGAPFLVTENANEVNEHQWSDETQLYIDTKWITVTAGYIHFHDSITLDGVGKGTNLITFTSLPNFVVPQILHGVPSFIATNSDAVFAQPEIHLTDKLDLVLGGRLTRDRKEGVDNGSPAFGPIPVNYRHDHPTYLAGLDYKPFGNALVYAKYATGYISGGVLGTRRFNPETSKSYEAGTKLDLYDRRLRTNLAVFHVDYSGLQISQRGLALGLPAIGQVIINGGDAKANGFELESTAAPIKGLTLSANVGYLDFRFTSVDPFIGTLATYLPINRPKWTGNAAVQYDMPAGFADARLVMRTDVNYQSKTLLAYNPSTPELKVNTVTPNIWILNARVALADLELAGKHAEIALWGRNLTDNRQFNELDQGVFIYYGRYQRARTYGIDVNFTF